MLMLTLVLTLTLTLLLMKRLKQQWETPPQQRNQKRQHFIHDYKTPSTKDTAAMDKDDWIRKTCDLTENMTIVQRYAFRTPLKILGPIGPYVMLLLSNQSFFFFFFLVTLSLFFLSQSRSYFSVLTFLPDFSTPVFSLCFSLCLSFLFGLCYFYLNRHHRIEHSFIVFKLKNGNKIDYVSLEKIREGILFQIAPSLETVKDYAKGDARGHVDEMNSFERSGLEGALASMASMESILKSEELVDGSYDVCTDNCQLMVSKLLTRLSEKSLVLKFPVPGSSDSVALNDDKAITFVEKLFPKWARGEVQQFPEISEPFAFRVKGLPRPESMQHQLLIVKQRIIDALNLWMKEGKFEFLKGRKAIFSKLDRISFEQALNKTEVKGQTSATTIIEGIASMWSNKLDIVAVVENLAVILFHFSDGSKSRDHFQDVEQKLDLASQIHSYSKCGASCIYAVTITLSADGSEFEIGPVKKGKIGRRMNVAFPFDISDAALGECLGKGLEALAHQEGNLLPTICWFLSFIFTPPLRRFATKLFLLQNMRNKDYLIHERLVKQEFGPAEFCIWTPQQKKIIDEAREHFQKSDQPKIRWTIQGCFGSGKTLLLMQLVKEFFESGRKGNVFVYVNPVHEKLRAMLQRHVVANGWQDRVYVGRASNSIDEVSLLLWDEFEFFSQGLLPYQKNIFRQFGDQIPTIILFTSAEERRIKICKPTYDKSLSWMNEMEVKTLGGNLRSSAQISAMNEKFQKFLRRENWAAGEPVVSNLKWNCSQPTIISFRDDSNDRLSFLERCEIEIGKLAEQKKDVAVCVFAHGSLRAKLKNECEKRENVSFGSSNKILGYQYQCLIAILDVATCSPPMSDLVKVTTRATTSLLIILNTSSKPIYIDATPSHRREFCLTREIESRVKRLTSDVASLGKKIWIRDRHDLLRASFVDEIKDDVVVDERDSWGTEEETREESKKYSLTVDLNPPHIFGGAFLSTASSPPFIEITVTDDEKELSYLTKRYDPERERKGIVDFFVSY